MPGPVEITGACTGQWGNNRYFISYGSGPVSPQTDAKLCSIKKNTGEMHTPRQNGNAPVIQGFS